MNQNEFEAMTFNQLITSCRKIAVMADGDEKFYFGQHRETGQYVVFEYIAEDSGVLVMCLTLHDTIEQGRQALSNTIYDWLEVYTT